MAKSRRWGHDAVDDTASGRPCWRPERLCFLPGSATTSPDTGDVSTSTSSQTEERSGGSRAYLVTTTSELSARADAVVVGSIGASPREEPADEGGASGLTMTTTSVTVETWIKGQGPSSMSLSELNLTETEDEVAQVESGRRYVLFLEEVPYGSGVRHILVGGGPMRSAMTDD